MTKRTYIRKILRIIISFIKLRLLHVNDSTHSIALGFALGLFVGFTPLLGLHIVIVLALTVLFRANKLAGLVTIWVNNPFTLVPIYYYSYLLGRAVLCLFNPDLVSAPGWFQQLLAKFSVAGGALISIWDAEFWRSLGTCMLKTGAELWLGCSTLGLLTALLGYFAAFYLITCYRQTHPHRRYVLSD